MIKVLLLFAVALALVATPATPERIDMYETFRLDAERRTAVFEPKRAERWPRVDARIVAMVDEAADRHGIPRHIMHEHVRRESGYRADARNPKSTATGLLQVLRGSHAAIIGRPLSKAEHLRLASDPRHNLNVGAAHIKACMQLMPGASARDLWRRCHMAGHANVGGRIEMAAAHFRPDASGWLQRGTIAWLPGGGA